MLQFHDQGQSIRALGCQFRIDDPKAAPLCLLKIPCVVDIRPAASGFGLYAHGTAFVLNRQINADDFRILVEDPPLDDQCLVKAQLVDVEMQIFKKISAKAAGGRRHERANSNQG
ncbi:MAG TPA: hypothetical protein VMF86_07025 [Stellaceae bacterium]|nr:hypothetical protein [Stellaceae bacterium]